MEDIAATSPKKKKILIFILDEKRYQREVKGKSQISNLYFMSHDTCLANHLCFKDRKEKENKSFYMLCSCTNSLRNYSI